jgi:hypothetical protein
VLSELAKTGLLFVAESAGTTAGNATSVYTHKIENLVTKLISLFNALADKSPMSVLSSIEASLYTDKREIIGDFVVLNSVKRQLN